MLKEESFGTLVISKWKIAGMGYDNNGSNYTWGSCNLRKYLNADFFNSAFTDTEKKQIVLSKLEKTKESIFVLTKQEVCDLILKDGSDPYEDSRYESYHCGSCYWTRTNEVSKVYHGYAKGCWCIHYPNNTYAVRPAMYIREK